VRVAGAVILIVALLTLALFIGSTPEDRGTRTDVAITLAILGALLVCGWGLAFARRWAWPVGVVVGLAGVILGIWLYRAAEGDITELGAVIGALLFMILPGALILICLATPRAIRWFRHGRWIPRRSA
jgi:hypothetical protein